MEKWPYTQKFVVASQIVKFHDQFLSILPVIARFYFTRENRYSRYSRNADRLLARNAVRNVTWPRVIPSRESSLFLASNSAKINWVSRTILSISNNDHDAHSTHNHK